MLAQGKLCVSDAALVAGGTLVDVSAFNSPAELAKEALQEIDVDLSMALAGSQALVRLSLWLGRAVVAARATLRSLRLSGPLHLGAVFQAMAPFAAQFTQLEQVLLARGSDEWQVDIAAQTLRLLPALERLQIRFSFDDEEPPQDLLGTLLPRRLSVSLDAATVAAAAEAGMALPLGMPAVPPILRNLLHLALIFPPRSVIPPTAHLPETLSTLTQLTSLKMKRTPMLSVPMWLGALTHLRYLLWDPALPADSEFTMPEGLGSLTNLEFLWIVHQVPLILPTSLAPTLRGVHTMSKGFTEDKRWLQHWGWLQPFSKLESIRFQGMGLTHLPHELLDKSQLTRMDLMVNQLEELPVGPYVSKLRCVHLGNNQLQRFPSALLQASKLEVLYLANQAAQGAGGSGMSSPSSVSSSCSTPQRGAGVTRRMDLTESDVEGLLGMRRLRTIVMNNMQPQVLLGTQPQDFTWLQRALKSRGCRLTSNELAYQLQSKSVFDLQPLDTSNEAMEEEEEQGSVGGSCSLGGASSEGTPAQSPTRAHGGRRTEF